MNAIWILTANAGHARFFQQEKAGAPLQELDEMLNAAARQRIAETVTDRVGPTSATNSAHNIAGAAPNKTYEPAQTPAEHAMEMFARQVAAHLLQTHRDGRYRQLVLTAAPEFLGVLRKLLDAEVSAAIDLEINRDYTQATPQELNEHVRRYREAGG